MFRLRSQARRQARGRTLLAVGAIALGAVALTACKPPVLQAACDGRLVATSAGPVANASIDEASGIAASRLVDDVYWVHNDSGNPAEVYAVGANGANLGTDAVSGANNVDWEDIAVGPGPTPNVPFLYLADIGDNTKTRATVDVYRMLEPTVNPAAPTGGTLTAEKLTFTYPDGAHDAEAFMVDPISGQLYIVTKAPSSAQVFRAPVNLPAGSTTVLTQVATIGFGFLPGLVTGADITPQGDTVALRTYTHVLMYQRPKDQPLEAAFSQQVCLGATPGLGTAPTQELQGEAIGFTRSGKGYVTIAEGTNQYLHFFNTP
ncbi:MAG: PE-PGRS family protein [Acidimicrobiia bacterium]